MWNGGAGGGGPPAGMTPQQQQMYMMQMQQMAMMQQGGYTPQQQMAYMQQMQGGYAQGMQPGMQGGMQPGMQQPPHHGGMPQQAFGQQMPPASAQPRKVENVKGKQLSEKEIERERMRQRMMGKSAAAKPKVDLDNLLGSIAAKPVPAAPSFGGAGITQQAQFGGGPAGGASGGTDDFSDFAAAPTAASMGPSSGFGDFTTAPAQAGASSGGLGDFSAPTMSASGGTTAPPAAEGSDDFGAFSGTVDASESAKSGGAVQEEPPKPTVSIDDLVANVATEIGSNSPASARKKFEKKKKTLATARKIERKVDAKESTKAAGNYAAFDGLFSVEPEQTSGLGAPGVPGTVAPGMPPVAQWSQPQGNQPQQAQVMWGAQQPFLQQGQSPQIAPNPQVAPNPGGYDSGFGSFSAAAPVGGPDASFGDFATANPPAGGDDFGSFAAAGAEGPGGVPNASFSASAAPSTFGEFTNAGAAPTSDGAFGDFAASTSHQSGSNAPPADTAFGDFGGAASQPSEFGSFATSTSDSLANASFGDFATSSASTEGDKYAAFSQDSAPQPSGELGDVGASQAGSIPTTTFPVASVGPSSTGVVSTGPDTNDSFGDFSVAASGSSTNGADASFGDFAAPSAPANEAFGAFAAPSESTVAPPSDAGGFGDFTAPSSEPADKYGAFAALSEPSAPAGTDVLDLQPTNAGALGSTSSGTGDKYGAFAALSESTPSTASTMIGLTNDLPGSQPTSGGDFGDFAAPTNPLDAASLSTSFGDFAASAPAPGGLTGRPDFSDFDGAAAETKLAVGASDSFGGFAGPVTSNPSTGNASGGNAGGSVDVDFGALASGSVASVAGDTGFGDFNAAPSSGGVDTNFASTFGDMTAPLPQLPPTNTGVTTASSAVTSVGTSRTNSDGTFATAESISSLDLSFNLGAPTEVPSQSKLEPQNTASSGGSFGDFASSAPEPAGLSSLKEPSNTGSTASFGDFAAADTDLFAPPKATEQNAGSDLSFGAFSQPLGDQSGWSGPLAVTSSGLDTLGNHSSGDNPNGQTPPVNGWESPLRLGGGASQASNGDKYAAFGSLSESAPTASKISDLAPLMDGVHKYLSDAVQLLNDSVAAGVGPEISSAAEADTYFGGIVELRSLSRRVADVARSSPGSTEYTNIINQSSKLESDLNGLGGQFPKLRSEPRLSLEQQAQRYRVHAGV